ncbi:hypothetical protein OQA88_6475 [Cercophora sp. LCS_1]
MPPAIRTTPDSDEPPIKRLRVERPQHPIVPPLVKLQSPRGTFDSAREFASSSSRKQYPDRAISFRGLLFKQKKPEATPDRGSALRKTPGPRTSIAPIFKQNVASAFEDEDAPSQPFTFTLQPPREPTPDTDPEDMLQQLKKHYVNTAETLGERVQMRMDQGHDALCRKLLDAVKGEDAFLAEIDKQHNILCRPLSEYVIRSTLVDPASGEVDPAQEIMVDKLVTDAQQQLIKYERELGGLWKEWEAAEAEVDRVYRETTAEGHFGQGGNKGVARISEMLDKFRDAIEKEVEDAEGDINELSKAALAMAKEIEKDYRKATLPDLRVFFQSIDEP